MRGMKRTAGKSALFALLLWFALAVGNVWASDQAAPGEGMPTADPHSSAQMQDYKDAGHAVVTEHAAEAAAVHGEAAAGHGDPHAAKKDSLSPDKLKDLGFRVMNFIVLLIILVKFGAKPIADGLGARRKQIREEIEDLEAKKSQAEKAYRDFSAKLESVEKDVGTIVQKAVAQAEIEKAKIIEKAEQSAADIKRQAEMVIANEITAAKRTLQNEVAEQAAVMAEELIVKNLTPEDQVKITEDYLDKVGAVQ
ncbi:MAG: ATP synthase F0 subunit B [Proteobacteria bacterium]|nr:ATP synthase F0 subunit B [Pseudomonadota bacterium]